MACAITATAGSSTANSYATIAEGDTYHETHLYADDWANADSDTKCRALQTATRLLDNTYEWYGAPTDDAQSLLWPRSGVYGPNGYQEASDEIPTRIMQGTCELARILIAGDRTADSDADMQGLKRVKAGSVEVEFKGDARTKTIPDSVAAFVSFYGQKRPSGGTVTLRRA